MFNPNYPRLLIYLTASVFIGRSVLRSSQSEAGAHGPERLLGVARRTSTSDGSLDLSGEGHTHSSIN